MKPEYSSKSSSMLQYKYTIIRSARKSISVNISAHNEITVRCPWSVREEKINEFLNSKSGWINKVVSENSLRLAKNDDIVEGRKVYVYGEQYGLLISAENKTDHIENGVIYLKNLSGLQKLLVNAFSEEFLRRFAAYSQQFTLNATGVCFKDYSARWGCCDSAKRIIFNYRIFMLPERLQDYVMIHELCHTVCMNHSHGFWRLMGDTLPDYKARKEELKYYDFLVGLY